LRKIKKNTAQKKDSFDNPNNRRVSERIKKTRSRKMAGVGKIAFQSRRVARLNIVVARGSRFSIVNASLETPRPPDETSEKTVYMNMQITTKYMRNFTILSLRFDCSGRRSTIPRDSYRSITGFHETFIDFTGN
jgi:hypothetical protein